MDVLLLEWAGKERAFQLDFGRLMDLEEACGGVGIGAIYAGLASTSYKIDSVYHTIRLALIGGGESVASAAQLMKKHFDTRPLLENHAVAVEIMLAVMVGVEPAEPGGPMGDTSKPHKFSEVSQICRTFNMSPEDLRRMRYADFLNMVRGFNAASEGGAEAPSEDEFADMLARYEARQADG